jgi:LETM1 and EF-hand domain-containing protein 1
MILPLSRLMVVGIPLHFSKRSLILATLHDHKAVPLMLYRYSTLKDSKEPIKVKESPVPLSGTSQIEKQEGIQSTAIVKKSKWQLIKEECHRYWEGTKLLYRETRLTIGLLFKMRRGESLSRRERMQIARTGADMIKLVPFSVFVIVPFLEFTLPFFLKFFPDMLPSTFEEKERTELKMKKRDQVKLEMSKLIHDTLEQYVNVVDPSNDGSGSNSDKPSNKISTLLKKYRVTGQTISTLELLEMIQSLFPSKTTTVESLSPFQAKYLCRYMDLPVWGTDNMLRYRLSNKLAVIQQDDTLLDKEGVDSLTLTELKNACQSRGIVVHGFTEEQIKGDLQQWIDLSVKHHIAPLALALARALILSDASYNSKST